MKESWDGFLSEKEKEALRELGRKAQAEFDKCVKRVEKSGLTWKEFFNKLNTFPASMTIDDQINMLIDLKNSDQPSLSNEILAQILERDIKKT